MKQQSIHDLWTIKQMVLDCPYPHTHLMEHEQYLQCGTAIIERINKVLLEENGAEAVLYSHDKELQKEDK